MPEPLDHATNEAEIAALVRREHARELSLCEDLFNHLGRGFNQLPSPFELDDQRRSLTIQLTTLGYNSVRWSLELLLKGYYDQAVALARLAWEAWLNGAYLTKATDTELEEWTDYKKRPKPWEMRKILADRTHPLEQDGAGTSSEVSGLSAKALEFKESLDNLYSGYSNYSHPSDWSTKVLLGRDESGFRLRFGGHYDRALTMHAANLVLAATDLLYTLLVPYVGDAQAYFDDGEVFAEALRTWQREVPSEAADPSESGC